MSIELVPGHSWGWQSRADCRLVDPALFYPPERESAGDRIRRERTAKTVCSTCPVLTDCRDHALKAGEVHGVWGGTSERDRRRVW